VYALASQNRVREAVKLVRNEAVTHFRWNGDGTKLRAKVDARGGPFETDLLRDDEGGLTTACTCSSGFDRFCTHALAVLVVTLRATRNAPFYTEQDRQEYLDPIRKKLGHPAAARATSDAGPQIRVEPSPPAEEIIALHAIDGTGPPWLGRYTRRKGRPVAASDLPSPLLEATEPGLQRVLRDPEKFLNWLGTAADPFDLEVRRGERTHAVRRVPTRPAHVELVIQSDGKKSVTLSLSIRLGEAPYAGRLQPCGAGLVHALDAGELCPLMDPDRALAAISFLRQLGAEQGATRTTLAMEDFAGLDAETCRRIRPQLLGADGAACEPVEVEPRFCIEIERAAADGTGPLKVEVRMEAAGTPLDSAARLLQAEQQFCFDRRVIETLAKRNHAQPFWNRMNALLAAPSDEARAAQAEAWEGANAEPCDHLLVRVLHRMRMHLAAADESIIVPGSEGDAAWVGVARPMQQAARVIGILRARLGIETRIGRQPRLVTPAADLADRASGFLAACPGLQIAVRTQGRPLQMASLRICVEAVESDDIDWFELKPEVWCGDLRIPQEQWERLIQGGTPDAKQFDGIRNESRRSLGLLAAMLANTAHGPRQLVSRLHFIQWLGLREQGVACSLPRSHERVLDALADLKELPTRESPHGLKAKLRPYQQRGFEWLAFLYEHRFGACLADDMGLGKTIQTIALLGEVARGRLRPAGRKPRQLPLLVVVPPTLLFNWQHELATFHPGIDVVEYTGQNRRTRFKPGQVVLTTYEIARRDIERLEKLAFDIAVFDEAQNVKNIASARAQAMRRIRAEFTLCLTGTPVENHAGEYLAILDLAIPGLFGKPSEFRDRLRQDDTLLRRGRPFVLRRTKTAILDELPPKVESDTVLDLSPIQKEMYTRATAEVREEVLQAFADKKVQVAGIVALAALTRLRQICVSPAILDPAQAEPAPKLERLGATLSELIEEGHSALVFSQFVRGLDCLGGHLTAEGIEFVRMDGKTPTARRKDIIGRFQAGEGPGVFLISLRTGGSGLNLTRASYVFHLDPWWNPAVENQASDRAHRIGQTGTVFVQRLLMRHTIEEKMMTLKARKAALFQSICEGAALDGSAGLLTRDDFRFLTDV